MLEENVLEFLKGRSNVTESYVLIRHLKIYLDLGHKSFAPKLEVKIWKSLVNGSVAFHATVSHYVHTPTQIGP